jgi:thioredoxin-like negative regulator of GroEL
VSEDEKTTFKDKTVMALLEQCVFVRVDTDKQPEIAKRMAVEGLPDIRFVLPDGRVIKRLRSFQDAESFSSELEQVLRKTKEVLR